MPYTLSTKLAMAQFVQTHCGGKALLHEEYKHLKIRDGKNARFGGVRDTRVSALLE